MPIIINIPTGTSQNDWGVVSLSTLTSLGITNLSDDSSIYPNLNIGCSSRADYCDYENIVFGNLSDSAVKYNDKTSFLQGRLGSNPTVFKIKKEGVVVATITDSSYGAYYTNGNPFFAGNNDYAGLVLEWRAVLSAFGQGCYTVEIDWDNFGTTETVESQCYKLYHYKDSLAEGTVSFEWAQRGKIFDEYYTFEGFTWTQYLRVAGFFGFNQPKYEETNIERSDRSIEQVEDRVTNNYTFESYLVPSYVTKAFRNDLILANEIYATDYNFYNHDQEIYRKPIRVVELGEFNYKPKSRMADFSITFGDRFEKKLKRQRF